MSFRYLLPYIEQDSQNIECTANNFHEYEIRFGRIDKKNFDPRLNKTTWMKIFDKVKNDTTKTQTILDFIYFTINKKLHFRKRKIFVNGRPD